MVPPEMIKFNHINWFS